MCNSVVLPQVLSVKRSLDTNMLLSLYTEGEINVLQVQTKQIILCKLLKWPWPSWPLVGYREVLQPS